MHLQQCELPNYLYIQLSLTFMVPDADYSCGCMDYGFRRPKEAWEASDGAVHLLKDLAERAPEAVPEFMPKLADIAALDDFEACRSLQTTIWKQLPPIAKGLGKRVSRLDSVDHSWHVHEASWRSWLYLLLKAEHGS